MATLEQSVSSTEHCLHHALTEVSKLKKELVDLHKKVSVVENTLVEASVNLKDSTFLVEHITSPSPVRRRPEIIPPNGYLIPEGGFSVSLPLLASRIAAYDAEQSQ